MNLVAHQSSVVVVKWIMAQSPLADDEEQNHANRPRGRECD
jgi:hypothetical protein